MGLHVSQKLLGVIDCTHIKLQSPGGENAEIFRNRKRYFSLNCQVICDASMKIRDLVCRWPGSAHDSHIFDNSAIKINFESEQMGDGVLLGDRGYMLRKYMITPIENPEDEVEILFNESQIRTRNIIERTFGVWKRRFPILSMGIRCNLELAQIITVACGVLHNIACDNNENIFEEEDEEQLGQEFNLGHEINGENNARAPFLDYFRSLILEGGAPIVN